MTVHKTSFFKSAMLRPVVRALAVALLFLLAGPALGQGSEGTWTKKGFAVEGTWKLTSEGGGWFLELSDGFSTKKAPDLKLFLSNKSVAELSNRNAVEGAVLVAQLKSHRGGQRYKLPAAADPAKFTTLVLHCEKYSKLWAAAPLR